jgi:hypothetical protein
MTLIDLMRVSRANEKQAGNTRVLTSIVEARRRLEVFAGRTIPLSWEIACSRDI